MGPVLIRASKAIIYTFYIEPTLDHSSLGWFVAVLQDGGLNDRFTIINQKSFNWFLKKRERRKVPHVSWAGLEKSLDSQEHDCCKTCLSSLEKLCKTSETATFFISSDVYINPISCLKDLVAKMINLCSRYSHASDFSMLTTNQVWFYQWNIKTWISFCSVCFGTIKHSWSTSEVCFESL